MGVVAVDESSLVMRIQVLLLAKKDCCPNALGLLFKIKVEPVLAAISEECTILHGVHLVGDIEKEVFIEFKVFWELKHDLSQAVEIL